MRFSIKDFFSKYDKMRRKLRIWSHLLKKSLMENFIFCAFSIRFSPFLANVLILHPPKTPEKLSISPEKSQKTFDFLTFSGGIESFSGVLRWCKMKTLVRNGLISYIFLLNFQITPRVICQKTICKKRK